MKISKFMVGCAAALVAAAVPDKATAHADPIGGLDHVLIWTRNIDQITSIMTVKLGFQVRPGGDFGDGVANRLIQFADASYLELLYFTLPEAELAGQPRAVYAETAGGPTANAFALEAGDVDAVSRQLREAGWQLAPDSPMTYDPDGDGPQPPLESLWRTVAFESKPLTSAELFFIRYQLGPSTPTQQADRTVFRRHPNGAERISAVWLLSADSQAERERLLRMGFISEGAVELPNHGLRGFRFVSGGETILALEPSGPGAAADSLALRGPHLYGISIAVADLALTRRIVERGYGQPLAPYQGLEGQAVTAPASAELGLLLEFHQSSPN